ncbi:transposase, partial [Leptospira weilii]|nr:transposase [Leptospira weilii]
MQAALKLPPSIIPNQSDRDKASWSEICMFLQWKDNRPLPFSSAHETQNKPPTKMRIVQDLNFSTAKILPSPPKPLTSAQLKEKRKNPAINIPFFTELTKKILNDFYPKYCP